MEASKDFSIIPQNWNGKLLQNSINNVISGLKKSSCKKVQFFLFAPYFIEGVNPGYSFNEADPEGSVKARIKENESFNKFCANIDFNNTAIRTYIAQFLNTACPNKSFGNSYSVSPKVYVKDLLDIADYINNYAVSAEADIAEFEQESIYTVYILSAEMMKGTDFQSHIPFRNYIVY